MQPASLSQAADSFQLVLHSALVRSRLLQFLSKSHVSSHELGHEPLTCLGQMNSTQRRWTTPGRRQAEHHAAEVTKNRNLAV